MTDYIVSDTNLTSVADKIRSKGGTSAQLEFPAGFISAIDAISGGGGGSAVVQALSVTQNGTYTPPSGVDGYAPVSVSVSGAVARGTTPPESSQGSDGDFYVQEHPLPENVDFVEYLESSGTQYIDTGIAADDGTDVKARCAFLGNYWILGARNNTSVSNATSMLVVTGAGTSTAYAAKRAGKGKASTQATCVTDDVYDFETHTFFDLPSNQGVIAVTLYGGTVDWVAISPISNAYTQILFGMNNKGVIAKDNARIYRVTYFQRNVPIADYLPCLDGNGVACMWDSVAGEYVYNDGTGDFAYGEAAVPDQLNTLWIKKDGAWAVLPEGRSI